MEAVKTAVRVLGWRYVFRLGLKAAVGGWIFPGLVPLSLAGLCSYGDCEFSTIVARWVGTQLTGSLC